MSKAIHIYLFLWFWTSFLRLPSCCHCLMWLCYARCLFRSLTLPIDGNVGSDSHDHLFDCCIRLYVRILLPAALFILFFSCLPFTGTFTLPLSDSRYPILSTPLFAGIHCYASIDASFLKCICIYISAFNSSRIWRPSKYLHLFDTLFVLSSTGLVT